MNKIFFLILLSIQTILYAKVVDGIALIIEGEVVTTAEIRAVQSQMHVSKEKATDLLIQNRLQKVALRHIVISEEEVDRKISEIAAQNKISIKKMQKILKQEGRPWRKYRKSINLALQKERFYQEKIIRTIPEPTEDELKLFHKKNKKLFLLPSSIATMEYHSKDEKIMQKFLKSRKKTLLKGTWKRHNTKKMESTLRTMLLQTANGSYTQSINAGDKYIAYKVISKTGKISLSFEDVKPLVLMKWKQAQQSKSLEDYFAKLRTNADIQILR